MELNTTFHSSSTPAAYQCVKQQGGRGLAISAVRELAELDHLVHLFLPA